MTLPRVACRTRVEVDDPRVEFPVAAQARQRGIIGQWQIPGQPVSWSGPFFVWPRALGDLQSEFESAFLEYELTSPADSVPSGELEPAT